MMTRSLQFGWRLAAVAVMACLSSGISQAETAGPTQTCQRQGAPGSKVPTPADLYPLPAAGWGPDAGRGLQVSRWVEDWSCVRRAGKAPALKAIPLGSEATGSGASLTLNAEVRARYDIYDNAQLNQGTDYRQGLVRGIAGADLRLTRWLRVYGEVGTGQVFGRSQSASANLQNVASLQQAFVDFRKDFGSQSGKVTTAGAMIGRQEFADGPRQLMSVGDGLNRPGFAGGPNS